MLNDIFKVVCAKDNFWFIHFKLISLNYYYFFCFFFVFIFYFFTFTYVRGIVRTLTTFLYSILILII